MPGSYDAISLILMVVVPGENKLYISHIRVTNHMVEFLIVVF